MPTLHLNTALAASFALALNAAVYPALSLANTASSMKCIHVLLPEICPACECTWRQFTWCFASHCSKAAMLQESRDVLPCQHEADLLRSQLAETQAALRAVTHRAESAETLRLRWWPSGRQKRCWTSWCTARTLLRLLVWCLAALQHSWVLLA